MLIFKSVLKLKDLPAGKKKKIEIGDEEILIANVKGKIYATQDRCGHMGVSLSRGEMLGSTLECPLHGSIFDIKTGKLISDQPRKALFKKMKKDFEDLLAAYGIPPVKIKPLKIYPVEIKAGEIHVGMEEKNGAKKEIGDILKARHLPPVKIKALKTYPVEVKKGMIYVGMGEDDKKRNKTKNAR